MSKRSDETVNGRQLEPPDAQAEQRAELPAPILLTELDVANLAYQRWVERGCPEGADSDDVNSRFRADVNNF